jgi:NAD(P)H-dependent FMN reductase
MYSIESKNALVLTHVVNEKSKTGLATELSSTLLHSLGYSISRTNTYKFPLFDFENDHTLQRVQRQIEVCQLLYVIVPTYNWNVPSGMKSWIDYAVKVDKNGAILQTFQDKLCVVLNLQGTKRKSGQANFVTDYWKNIMSIQGASKIFEKKLTDVTPRSLQDLAKFLRNNTPD